MARARDLVVASARWLAPSVVAACFASILAGAVECRGMDSVLGMVAAAGFLALVALPILLGVGVIVRGLWAAWAPSTLELIEEGGGSPRFAGWLVALICGSAGLAWFMWEGTWLVAKWTTFKVGPTAFAEPALALVAMLAMIVLSRPLARGFTAIIRAIDRRWRARGHASVITPTKLAVTLAVVAIAAIYVMWHYVLGPRLGPLDTDVLEAPAIAIVAVLFAHLAWRAWPRVRRIAGPVSGAIAVLLAGTALVAWQTQPSLTLTIWGDRPLAGLAIDSMFDLDSIRSKVSLAEFMPEPVPGADHPDIVLVTIDTVRADHTPPYNGTADMPVLKDLGKHATVFEWAYSPSNVTRRSIPSMIIGLAPDRIRGRVVGWALRVDPRHVLLAERMRAGGYETAGFMCCEGFYGKEMHTGLARGIEHLEMEPNGLALARRARAWLDERAKLPGRRPLFLWMHILEPHNWAVGSGDPVNDDGRRKAYDRTLTLSDSMLGELFGGFASRSPDKAPIVIITSDHGEGLGEHGAPFHSTDLYNSQTHVPLVIAGPGILAQRISETVSLTELTPSVLELAGFVPPTNLDGKSFGDLASGKRAQVPEGGEAYDAMIHDRSNPGGVSAVVLGKWKLIEGPNGLEVYDARTDSAERSNEIKMKPRALQSLQEALARHKAAAKTSPFR